MLKEKKFFSLPVTFTEIKDYSYDDSLIPVDVKVMHNGLNLNNSTFFDEAINEAKETLKNKPILGYIKKVDGTDQKDFAGHEIEISFGEEGLKVIYLERPLGTVPESNNYAIQEKDNKKYVTCRGYLWREYLNSGYEILKDNPNKSVSMEIAVDDYELNEDGSINITKFRYLGITILGDDVKPAMTGAELNVVGQFSEKFSKDFYSKIEKLNEDLKINFSQKELDNDDNTDSSKGGEEVEASKFATYNQKREALRNALDSVIIRDDENNIIEETYYWVSDFDDEYVYVERNHWTLDGDYNFDYGRFTYSFDTEKIEASIIGEFEKMILTWLTEEENQKILDERSQFELIKQELEDYKTKHTTLESEVQELKEYKSTKEQEEYELQIVEQRQAKIDHINEEYSTISDDIKELFINKVDEYESIEDIDSDICVYIVKNNVQFSKTKSKKQEVKNIKFGVKTDTNPIVSPYGDLF